MVEEVGRARRMNRWESRTRSKRKAGEVGGAAGRD